MQRHRQSTPMHPFFRLASSSRAATMAKGPLLPYYPALLRFPKPQNGFLNRVLMSDDFIFLTTAIIFLNLDSGLFFNALHAKNPNVLRASCCTRMPPQNRGLTPPEPKNGCRPTGRQSSGPRATEPQSSARATRAPVIRRLPPTPTPTADAAFGCDDAPWRCSAMLHDACLLYLPRRPTCPPSAAQLGRRGRRLPRRRAQAGNWRLHAPQRASCVDCSALVAPGARRGARATPGVAALLRLGLEARAAR